MRPVPCHTELGDDRTQRLIWGVVLSLYIGADAPSHAGLRSSLLELGRRRLRGLLLQMSSFSSREELGERQVKDASEDDDQFERRINLAVFEHVHPGR